MEKGNMENKKKERKKIKYEPWRAAAACDGGRRRAARVPVVRRALAGLGTSGRRIGFAGT